MKNTSPLQWPVTRPRTLPAERKVAQFSTRPEDKSRGWRMKQPLTIGQAVERLMEEIEKYSHGYDYWRINPEEVIISSDLKYRLDGLPYANQKEPEDVGVAIYFTLDDKAYCLPCDKWTRIADNIAAVAAHISANRGIERWGVGQSQDLFAGYAALPGPGQSTVVSCWEILGIAATKDKDIIGKAFKTLALQCHSDLGGSDSDMAALNEARAQALQYASS